MSLLLVGCISTWHIQFKEIQIIRTKHCHIYFFHSPGCQFLSHNVNGFSADYALTRLSVLKGNVIESFHPTHHKPNLLCVQRFTAQQ